TPVGTNWVVTTLAGNASIKDPFGNPVGGYADGSNMTARFNSPTALAVDTATNIYVTDSGNNTIRKVTPTGTNWVVTTLGGLAGNPGSVDGTNGQARFEYPQGIAVDNAGNLYVADTGGYLIRKLMLVGTNWVTTTVAGLGGIYGSADGTGR